MNTGAFGENFPYSNFHDLNTDWIIKIAKDFLDQYTHIQEVISNGEESLQNLTTDGLEQLQAKADALEALLQEWYNTHSEDIANQLADALEDLNNKLTTTIANFNTAADQKTAQSIASIPDDYTALDYRAKWNFRTITKTGLMKYTNSPIVMKDLVLQQGLWRHTTPNDSNSIITQVEPGDVITLKPSSGHSMNYCLVNNIDNILEDGATPAFSTGYTGTVTTSAVTTKTIPEGCHYLYTLLESAGIIYIPSSILINGFEALNTTNQNYNKIVNMIDYRLPRNERVPLSAWTTWTDNYFANADTGAIVYGGSDYSASDYIDIHGISKLGISRRLLQFAYYDRQKNYISGVPLASGNHDFTLYTPPANAYYVRLSAYQPKKNVTYISLVTTTTKSPIGDINVNKNANTDPDFTTLRNAITFANQYMDTKVYISNHTYNILDEFATELASLPLTSQIGLGLCNGTHLIGIGGATQIYCPYNGSDASVIEYLSPIYAITTELAKRGGYTLENIKIVSTNCRYSVHDEYGQFANPTITKIINCRFIHSDANAGSLASFYPQCIGGGLGQQCYIEITGCYFSTNRYLTEVGPAVSYHNTGASVAESTVWIRNCYFDGKSTLRVGSYGTATSYSKATIDNCSLGADAYNTPFSQDSPDNMELLSFNNTVR